jgi:hypothetical protein
MAWDLTGNSGTNQANNFLGTTDNQPLVIRTSAQERMRITPEGRVGIGTTTPGSGGGRVTIADDSVPLTLRETDWELTAGALWRMVLDGGRLRFDVNTAADESFAPLRSPLAMEPTGDVGVARNLTVAGNELRWGNCIAFRDSIELGAPDGRTGGGGTPFIDFHFGRNVEDFNIRIVNNADHQLTVFGAETFHISGPQLRWGNCAANLDSIELGAPDGNTPGIGTPFIDFHLRGKKQDYNTRIINDRDGRLSIYGAADSPRLVLGISGDVEATGDIRANDVFVNSDARLKTDIAPVPDALGKLQKLRGVAFKRLDFEESSGRPNNRRSSIGVIAQEVEDVFPELVDSHADGGCKAVKYSGLTGVLIEASKQLKQENDELRQRIDALEKATTGGGQ